MGSHYQEWVDKACKQIMDSLEVDGVSRVILVGEAGIGKTWLAREICERATEKTGSCYMALWLNLNKELDERSLYKNIASQLSIFLEKEGSEEDDSDNEDDEEQKNRDLMRLKDGILQKLRRKKLKREGKKNLLLVLDDEGSVTNEEKVMEALHLRDFLVRGKDRPLKILLTRRKEEAVTNPYITVESHFEKSKDF
ncbi:unnamed protein product [Microthlaspi erraticum]|uniref:NB-ARC domain-containing protein n=1 Tax=Microthlaspi erraticum TaxID=1685480 RepID=A0A6D2HE41_9BRAS|nr:unnamed protein product [Microthlaspi erraticum]